MKKRILGLLLCAAVALGAAGCSSSSGNSSQSSSGSASDSSASQTASWDAKNINLIVPLKAGGDTDFYARTYAKYLEQELGKTITVINVEGSGGTVGAQQVCDSAPDGTTMLFYHTGNMYCNKLLGVSDLDHNDFDIAGIGVLDDTNVFVASKNSGITDAEDFLSKAKADPGKINIATTISGFSYYALCKAMAVGGFSLNAVDVGSASAMVPAVLGDQTETALNSYGVFKQYIESGDVVPLFSLGKERNPNYPDIPTAKEVGLEGAEASRAYFIAFPKGTDESILKAVSDAMADIQNNEEYVKAIKDAYCVEPYFVPYNEAVPVLDEMLADMEQYKDALNNN